jgi:hypothetical protein
VASEALGWRQLVSTIENRDVPPADRINTPSPEQPRRSPLSGRFHRSRLPRAEALDYDLPPLRGEIQQPPGLSSEAISWLEIDLQ